MSIWTRRLSIRWIAPITIGGLVLAVALVLGLLAIVRGRESANELTDITMSQVHERIRVQLDDLLGLPARINRVNVQLLREGRLDTDDLRSWQRIMFEQIAAFPHLSCVAWGDERGNATWIARYPRRPHPDYAIKDATTGGDIIEYFYTDDGGIEAEPKARYAYDPRPRPWYKTSVDSGGPTWSKPFGWIDKEGVSADLGLSFAQPFRDERGDLVGVIDAEITLFDLSRFLHSLEIGIRGFAYIVDHDGNLLATSRGIDVADAKGKQIGATACGDERIEVSAHGLERSWAGLGAASTQRLDHRGVSFLVRATPYASGNGLSWVVVTVIPEDDFLGPVNEANWRTIGVAVFAVICAMGMGLLLGIRFARPIRALRTQARLIGEGNFDQEIKLDQSTEFIQLSDALNEMQEGLRDRMRMRESLAMAMEVQQSLLPSELPDQPGLDVAGHSTYCDETGGDYYDFLDISGTPEHELHVAVGDVMGHGVAAAMLMATARGILHSGTRSRSGLADLMTHMNELLVRDTEGERFMTMLLLTVDRELGRMRWASAGHGPPILYDPATDKFVELPRGQLPLGLVAGVGYHENTYRDLEAGQIILAATDALWETRNLEGEEFGVDRLYAAIRALADRPAQEISDGLRGAVEAWCSPRRPNDDLTLVVVKVL